MLKVNIRKKLNKFDLNINFNTDKDIIGLIGSSGSGKSMTLKCIAGIEKPDEGEIILNDRVLFDSKRNINIKPQDRRIAYLFQNYALFPNMTVYKNIFISVNNKYDNDIKKNKTKEIIKLLELNGLEDKYPDELSGGQQQRVALARIVVNEPEYLLLDEPFAALDAFLKWNLAKELKDTIKSFDKGTLFVTHNINEVYYLCKKSIILSNGEVVEAGDVQEIIENPKNIITKNMVEYSDLTRKDIDTMK